MLDLIKESIQLIQLNSLMLDLIKESIQLIQSLRNTALWKSNGVTLQKTLCLLSVVRSGIQDL
jgi:hypothetical protein